MRRAPPYLMLLALAFVLAFLAGICGGCAQTNYYVEIHPDAFKYADEVHVEPGQGGDSADSSTLAANPTGGEGMAPGIALTNRGFMDWGVIFNFGSIPSAEGAIDATVTP